MKHRFLSKAIKLFSLTLAVVMLGVFAGAIPVAADELTNVALGKSVTATSDYVPQEGYFSAAFLTDGDLRTIEGDNIKLGWSSDPYDTKMTDRNNPIDITINLDALYSTSSVIIHPMRWSEGHSFPSAYRVLVSFDGNIWTDVGGESDIDTYKGNFMTTPREIKFDGQNAKYVRIHITQAGDTTDQTGVYLVQLGEVEVIGKLAGDVKPELNKSALRMQPGEYDKLTLKYAMGTVTFKSSDENIVKVDETGKVTAVAYGSATVTASDGKNSAVCNVLIDNYSVLDKFMITTFRSPSKPHLNAETYDLLAAAGFTNIQNEWNTSVNTVEDNLLMAQLCYERGMDVTVSLGDWRDGFAGLSYEDVQKRLSTFSHVPGVGGVYIIDEPSNANGFAAAYKPIKDMMPNVDVHLNFLPMRAYENEELYHAQMYDFATLTDGRLDYLMFDLYPFGLDEGSFNESGWYANLDSVRKTGLELDIKTGTFMQSISLRNGYRRPNGDELRFNAYSAAAFGYKQIAYFCWETPNETDYGFGPAIVDTDGKPTEIYDPIAETNNELLKLGPTLMKLDALAVYISGKSCGYGDKLPADFFLGFADTPQLLVTYMKDKEDGTNYTMLVNRDLKAEQTITFTAADGITGDIYEISNKTGEAVKLTPDAEGKYTVTLRAGAGILLKMPETCNYLPDLGKFVQPEAGANVAIGALVSGNRSLGEDGQYFCYINDGKTTSDNEKFRGWDSGSCSDQKAQLCFDIGGSTKINRVVLYPEGNGSGLPKAFTIQVSEDGENWKTVATATDYKATDGEFRFDEADARYVKIDITAMRRVSGLLRAQIAEVEIYVVGEKSGETTEPDETTEPVTTEPTTTEPDETTEPVTTEPTTTEPATTEPVTTGEDPDETTTANDAETTDATPDTSADIAETTVKPDVTTKADGETTDDSGKKSGCGSAIAGSVVALTAVCGMALIKNKKKKSEKD